MNKQVVEATSHFNNDDPSLGTIVFNWTPRQHPLSNSQYYTLQGQYCQLELLTTKTHDDTIQQLYDAFKPNEDIHFKYLRYGPFKTVEEFKQFVYVKEQSSSDTVLYTISVDNIALGFISYGRINLEYGTIAITNINFSQLLARTRPATEAIFLLLQFAFDILGYRRIEWRCNSLNAKSRRAAERIGFQYEGTWKKAEIRHGRSRDHSWYSLVDDEWSQVKQEIQRWLNPHNFDTNGQQLTKLHAAQVNPRQKKIIEVN